MSQCMGLLSYVVVTLITSINHRHVILKRYLWQHVKVTENTKCICIRDRIVGNNHVAISYYIGIILQGIKRWLYGCRRCTVYVTILQLYNHRLTTWAAD